MRGGKRFAVDADQLVPGDIVAIKSGDRLPADLRLLQVTNLQVSHAVRQSDSHPASDVNFDVQACSTQK